MTRTKEVITKRMAHKKHCTLEPVLVSPEPDNTKPTKPLNKMNKAELQAEALSFRIDIEGKTKRQLLTAMKVG